MTKLKIDSRQMHKLYGPIWRYRLTAPGPDVGDKEHERIQALLDAARKKRRERLEKIFQNSRRLGSYPRRR